MTAAINPVQDYITQSQAATAAAKAQMANNVANGSNASGTSSTGSVTGNFNTFLKILTTQLQNQDPTAPMDTNQFTQELVEFSGVEQQLKSNGLLQQLVDASGAGGVRSLLGYVGQYVKVPANNQLLLQGGKADMSYTLPSAAKSVQLTIQDSTGKTVAVLDAPTANGVNNVVWDGTSNGGDQLPDGVYKLSVAALDTGGNKITPTDTSLVGLVTGVQTADSNGKNNVQLGPAFAITDTDITAVYSASSMAAANSGGDS